ncbi:MAG: porin family protein [Prevotella sp.]|nr:porin family protein [Prevotella sp.]
MKKYLSVMLLVAAMMFAQQADAQLKFGLKGGLNVSKFSFSEKVFDSSNRAGWFVGPSAKFTLPIVGLSMDASALYNQISSTVQNVDAASGETTVKQQTIQVPVNVRYGFGLGSLASVFVFAGPQFGFNVGDDTFNWKSSSSYENTFQLKKSQLSVNVGAGVTLNTHLQLSANYNIACGKTGDATVLDVVNNTVSTISDGRANSWQIALAYYF